MSFRTPFHPSGGVDEVGEVDSEGSSLVPSISQGGESSSSASAAAVPDVEAQIRKIGADMDVYRRLFGIESASPDLGFMLSGPAGSSDIVNEIEVLEKTLGQLKFHLRYGDYAGRVWNCLQRASRRTSKPLSSSVVNVRDNLATPAKGLETFQTLEEAVRCLQKDGWTKIGFDTETAKVAINVYATRNQLCHRESKAKEQLRKDCSELASLLPDELAGSREHMVRIVNLWGDAEEWLAQKRARAPDTSQSRFRANNWNSHSEDEQKEFKRALSEGLLQPELDHIYEGGSRRPHTPRRTRASVRSEPFSYVPCKRELTLSPPSSPSQGQRPLEK